MNTISLETAQALKDAGLKWEPEIYDLYTCGSGIEMVEDIGRDQDEVTSVNEWNNWKKYCTFLPSLSQLLELGDRDGYDIEILSATFDGKTPLYRGYIKKWDENSGLFFIHSTKYEFKDREEAAAQAYLWILRQKEAANGY